MRRWSSTVGGGFICRKAGWIQERRVDDETDNLHGDGGICGGMAMGATRLVPRLLILESASVGEKIWIYRTPEQGSIVKGESRGDYPEGGTAWTFRVYLWMEQEQEGITLRFDGEQVVGRWGRRIRIVRWRMASTRFQILAVRWTGPQDVFQTVPR